MAQSGGFESSGKACILVFRQLAVDQQAKAFVEAYSVDRGCRMLLAQCFDHSVQVQSSQLVQDRVGSISRFRFQVSGSSQAA